MTSARRTKIDQADWAGLQYMQAIGSYYESAPPGANVYPDNLEALLADGRGPISGAGRNHAEHSSLIAIVGLTGA